MIDAAAEPDFVVSAWETAVIVTVAGLGGFVGALYRPAESIVPTVVGSPPVMPLTCQVTAVFVVPVTVAVNCTEPPTDTLTGLGVTLTVIPGGGGGPELPPPLQESKPRESRSSANVSAAQGLFRHPNPRRLRDIKG